MHESRVNVWMKFQVFILLYNCRFEIIFTGTPDVGFSLVLKELQRCLGLFNLVIYSNVKKLTLLITSL